MQPPLLNFQSIKIKNIQIFLMFIYGCLFLTSNCSLAQTTFPAHGCFKPAHGCFKKDGVQLPMVQNEVYEKS